LYCVLQMLEAPQLEGLHCQKSLVRPMGS